MCGVGIPAEFLMRLCVILHMASGMISEVFDAGMTFRLGLAREKVELPNP